MFLSVIGRSVHARMLRGAVAIDEAAEVAMALANSNPQAMVVILEPVIHASTAGGNVLPHRRQIQDIFMGCQRGKTLHK